jgi:hypothetical protein
MKLRMTKRAHPRPVSIRWSLFTNFLILVVLISGSLLVYSLAGATRAIRSLSASLFEEVSRTAAPASLSWIRIARYPLILR